MFIPIINWCISYCIWSIFYITAVNPPNLNTICKSTSCLKCSRRCNKFIYLKIKEECLWRKVGYISISYCYSYYGYSVCLKITETSGYKLPNFVMNNLLNHYSVILEVVGRWTYYFFTFFKCNDIKYITKILLKISIKYWLSPHFEREILIEVQT